METEHLLAQLILRHRDTPGGLLPLLQDIQEALGFIPDDSIAGIASAMNLSPAEVHGVVSFYHDLHNAPRGKHVLQICCAESCQSMGSDALAEQAHKSLGINFGETSADGNITLEKVYCLGNCACSPSIRINDKTHARVNSRDLDTLCAALLAPRGTA